MTVDLFWMNTVTMTVQAKKEDVAIFYDLVMHITVTHI